MDHESGVRDVLKSFYMEEKGRESRKVVACPEDVKGMETFFPWASIRKQMNKQTKQHSPADNLTYPSEAMLDF